MNLLIMGPPGAGKGTQAEIICKEVNLEHLSSGDLLRAEVKSQSDLGKQAESYMKAGELVPDSLMIEMILQRVQAVTSSDKGFMLDGFPRTVEQAKALDASFEKQGIEVNLLVNLKVSEDEIVERLTSRRICTECNGIFNIRDEKSASGTCEVSKGEHVLTRRKDDHEDVIRQRLKVYKESTSPIIDYYNEKHELLEIDGSQEKDKITALILSGLNRAN